MSNLTPKQEKFVQALISGMSQREAYKEAYNAANMKNEVIHARISEDIKKESETINTLKKYIYGIFYNKAFDGDMPPNVIRLDLLCTDVLEGFCQG